MDQFNHNILERDIEILSKEIAEKRNLPEYKNMPEKELIRQTLQPMVKPQTVIPQSVNGQKSMVNSPLLPDYLNDSPAAIKLEVEKLIDSVLREGVEKAAKRARESGAFVLDAFHDALTDKLYDALKERGLI